MKFDLYAKYNAIKINLFLLFKTATIGLIGSLIFVYLQLPLPWLLGALLTTTSTAMLGQKIWVPNWLRIICLLILGALFGSAVSPGFLDDFLTLIPSIIAVTAYVLLVMPPIILYLMKIVKLDLVTAYFASAPGGVLPMTFIGKEMGGDAKVISLMQSARIILTVLIIPISYTLFAGYIPSGEIGSGGSFSTIDPISGLVLLTISVIGFFVVRPLKIPTPSLMGPMIAVSLISMLGYKTAEVPDSLVAIAQCLIGSSIGAMFNDIKPKTVTRILFHGTLTSMFMIIFAVGTAMVTFHLTEIPTKALILAFAPGGFAEMALVGFALGIDVAFVVTHQLTRYFFVILILPIIYKAFR
ncbi:MAG: AbrB family transcriptional regulator [Pseudomonadota bacterium]|nr:AbrB family transcriptional regulator [Pseudomonadota bacterium]